MWKPAEIGTFVWIFLILYAISISNMDTFKFKDQCLISQLKISYQGMTIRGNRRRIKISFHWHCNFKKTFFIALLVNNSWTIPLNWIFLEMSPISTWTKFRLHVRRDSGIREEKQFLYPRHLILLYITHILRAHCTINSGSALIYLRVLDTTLGEVSILRWVKVCEIGVRWVSGFQVLQRELFTVSRGGGGRGRRMEMCIYVNTERRRKRERDRDGSNINFVMFCKQDGEI